MNEIVFEPLPEMQDERIDKCISSYLENLSRSYIQKMIKEKRFRKGHENMKKL